MAQHIYYTKFEEESQKVGGAVHCIWEDFVK